MKCLFGEESARARYLSSSSVECRTPAAFVGGTVPFSLTMPNSADNVILSTAGLSFNYYEDILVTSVYPLMGMMNTPVTVRGVNFVPSSTFSCQFGVAIVSAKFINDSEVTCISPPYNLQKKVPVTVSVNGVEFAPSEATFEYILSPPQILSIRPSIGSTLGGTLLTIIGSGFFDSSELICSFGNHATVLGQFVSEKIVRCITPEYLEQGIIMVEVLMTGSNYSTNGVLFRYIVPPRVTAIHPRNGPSTGNTIVVFHGHNFIDSDTLTCRFGNHDSIGRFISKSKVECTTPAGKAGQVVSHLTLNGIDFYESPVPFEYHNQISLRSFSPKSSHSIGGTHITLEGDNFLNSSDLKCSFGGIVVQAVFYSASKLGCAAPAGLIGKSSITASNNGVDFSNPSYYQFEYYRLPNVKSIKPKQGIPSKYSVLSVFGSGFLDDIDLSCSFGNITGIPARYISSTELTCVVPQIMSFVGGIAVEVSINNYDYTNDGVLFELINEPQIHKIWPSNGPVDGGTKVTVSGFNFLRRLGISCYFGTVKVLGLFISPGIAECEAPRFQSPEQVMFSVSVAGETAFSNSVTYNYLPSVVISLLTPQRWADTWTGSILVNGKGFYVEEGCPWTCLFGEMVTLGEFISAESLVCELPAGKKKQTHFSLHYPCSQNRVNTSIILNTVEALVLLSLWPSSSPTTASIPLIVEAANIFIEERYICLFDDIRMDGFILNTTHITCESPEGGMPRIVTFSIAYADVPAESASGGVLFAFYQPPEVIMIHPAVSQSSNSGELISITGNGFRNSRYLKCKFGDIVDDARWSSSQHIKCRIPLQRPGIYAVEVSNNAADFSSNNTMHEVLPEMEIYTVFPRKAALPGGVEIKVTGIGFHDSLKLNCTFGETFSVATIINERELNCLSPARQWATMQPFKICNDAERCVETGLFEFFDSVNLSESVDKLQISIANTSSNIVSDCGDADIFLSGYIFPNTLLECSFISTMVSVRVNAEWFSPHMISCRIPRLQTGSYSLFVAFGNAESSNMVGLTVIACPVINEIWPSSGDISGGTLITVLGKDFIQRDVYCVFGNRRVLAQEVLSSSIIKCRSTPGDIPGLVPLSLTFHNASVKSSIFQYRYTDPVHIRSILPEVVDQISPMEFVIYGTGFPALRHSKNLTCRIGRSLAVKVQLGKNESYLTCDFDNFAEAGALSLQIEDESNVIALKPDAVQVVTRPFVLNISPSWMRYSDVGKKIAVFGKGFVNTEYLSCFFNNSSHRALFLSESQVWCFVPDVVDQGDIKLAISNDRRHFTFPSFSFRILRSLNMHSVVPDCGWTGTYVTIRGQGFSDGLSCGFGSSFSNATVLHKNELNCVVPPLTWLEQNLSVPIQLIFGGLEMLPEVSHYFRFVKLITRNASPLIGSTSGGTSVTIQLRTANANEVKQCRFGKNVVIAAPSSVNQITEVNCIAPFVVNAGRVPLSLSTNGVNFVPSGVSFLYVENPIIDKIYPDNGTWRGGTIVTVSGSKILESMHLGCRFGGMVASGSWISNELFFCLTPALPLGLLSFSASVNMVDFFATSHFYDAVEEMRLTHLSPDSAPVKGGVNVTIFGENFRNTAKLSCRFDETKVLARFISSQEVICLAPPLKDPMEVKVSVSDNGDVFYACPVLFRYHSDLAIFSFFPQSGHYTGSTSVTLSGYNFLSGPTSYKCIFGESFVDAVIISESFLKCDSPPSTKVGRVRLLVSGPGFLLPASESFFTYQPIIETFGVFPSFGSFALEQVITIYGAHFSRDSAFCCKIYGQKTAAVFISSTEAKCMIKKDDVERPGLIDIYLSIDGQHFSENALHYEITDSVQAVGSRQILRRDGNGIVLLGFGFLPFDDLVCQFKDKHFIVATFFNNTHAECNMPTKLLLTTPPVEALLLSGRLVSLSSPDTNEKSLDKRFLVQSVTPILSSTSGGTIVTISLRTSNAEKIHHCIFGDNTVAAIKSNNNPLHTVSCITPASNNTGKVMLSFGSNDIIVPSGIFIKFFENALVQSIHPESGPSTGATKLTIFGSNFREDMHLGCRFGKAFVDGVWVSKSRFSCTSPSLPGGAQKMEIIANAVVIDDSYSFFVYNDFPVYKLQQMSFSNQGEIMVGGNGFFYTSAFTCRFGLYTVPARFVNSSRIGCTPPQLPQKSNDNLNNAREVRFQISANSQNYFPSEMKYTFTPRPIVIGM